MASRQIRCFADCLAQETGEPMDCDCAHRAAMAEDAELDNRVDRLRDAMAEDAYERHERDRDRALPGERRLYEQ